MTDALQHAAKMRMDAILATSDERRRAFAQHLTPPETAKLAVPMFSDLKDDQQFVRCLDLGAGTGMLFVARCNRYDGHIEQLDAVETDEALVAIYEA